MLPKVALVSLLSLVLVLSAAGLECRIYVSSSDGINNTSCWTGGLQTPCATIDLAIQGTPTLQYNCSSGILINLSPGTYTLDTTSLLEQQLLRNNVSIIGMRDGSRYEEVSITCLHVSSSSYNWLKYIVFQCVTLYNCNIVPVTCTEPSSDFAAHNKPVLGNEACPNYTLHLYNIDTVFLYCYDYYQYDNCQCDYLSFNADITDTCTNNDYDWIYGLNVCISINSSMNDCYIIPQPSSGYDYYNDKSYYVNKCFNDYIGAGPIEVSIYTETLNLININASRTVTVTTECIGNRDCNTINTCNISLEPHYKLPCLPQYIPYIDCCYNNSTDESYINCESKGVLINNIYTCVECNEYSLLVFFVIEIFVITVMVLLIMILNIQLTNGSINGVVFYAQVIMSIYSVYYYYYYYPDPENKILSFFEIPCNIFNLDLTQFMYNYSICTSDRMTPLGAISFWYVIGFYPLLLLLLLYIWMTLYHKGFKYVVFITRPFHRCMARFWSMTGIEPSFTDSIASIYILCFTQLTATSFKILSFTPIIPGFNDTKFFYDIKQDYFKGVHGAAGFFAILVLLFLIILPTLCILFYPFKWFQKLLDCLHLRKPLLITLADVFTGPYKNGTENTFDYRFMAGLYLLAKIFISSQYIMSYFFILLIPISQAFCSFLLAVIVIIFRPFRRNIHNFSEFLMMFVVMGIGCASSVASWYFLSYDSTISSDDILYPILVIVIPVVNGLIFFSIIPGYIIYQVYKVIKSCHYYRKKKIPVIPTEQEYEDDVIPIENNWAADRMENPQDYDEHHVPLKPYDLLPINKQPSVAAAVEELKRPLLDTQN